jgi:hypothetical protein
MILRSWIQYYLSLDSLGPTVGVPVTYAAPASAFMTTHIPSTAAEAAGEEDNLHTNGDETDMVRTVFSAAGTSSACASASCVRLNCLQSTRVVVLVNSLPETCATAFNAGVTVHVATYWQ